MLLRRVYRQRLRCLLLLLLPVLLWLVIAEFGLYHLYSLLWYWPTTSWVSPTFSQATSCVKNKTPYCHNPLEDSYYFPAWSDDNSTATKRSKDHLSELKILVFSDPHIMCTYPWVKFNIKKLKYSVENFPIFCMFTGNNKYGEIN